MKAINVGVPDEVNLEVQEAVDVTQWFRIFDGKPILLSVSSGGLIMLTVTAHGLATNNIVVVDGAVDPNANGVWTITVVDANRYTLNGSTWTTNGAPAGLAGQIKNYATYTGAPACSVFPSYSNRASCLTVTAAFTGTANDGLIGLLFTATNTTATGAAGGVYDVRCTTGSGNKERPLKGTITLVNYVTT